MSDIITQLLSKDFDRSLLSSLVSNTARDIATKVNNGPINDQIDFLKGFGLSDEDIMRALTPSQRRLEFPSKFKAVKRSALLDGRQYSRAVVDDVITVATPIVEQYNKNVKDHADIAVFVVGISAKHQTLSATLCVIDFDELEDFPGFDPDRHVTIDGYERFSLLADQIAEDLASHFGCHCIDYTSNSYGIVFNLADLYLS